MPAQRKWRATRIHIFFCLLLIGLVVTACDGGNNTIDKAVTPTPMQPQNTQDYQPPSANKATEGGPLSPDKIMELTINLAYKMDAVEQDLAQSGTASLTPDQIAQRY